MQGIYYREYGVEATVDFVLWATDGASFQTGATHVVGDAKIMKDEGAEANTSNGFTDEGQGYSLVLAAAEMQAARIVVYIVDQTNPAIWLDEVLIIETYDHANAQHLNLAEVVAGGHTVIEMFRLILAAFGGKTTGAGTLAPKFRDVGDTKNAIEVTLDDDGNRTAVSMDGS